MVRSHFGGGTSRCPRPRGWSPRGVRHRGRVAPVAECPLPAARQLRRHPSRAGGVALRDVHAEREERRRAGGFALPVQSPNPNPNPCALLARVRPPSGSRFHSTSSPTSARASRSRRTPGGVGAGHAVNGGSTSTTLASGGGVRCVRNLNFWKSTTTVPHAVDSFRTHGDSYGDAHPSRAEIFSVDIRKLQYAGGGGRGERRR